MPVGINVDPNQQSNSKGLLGAIGTVLGGAAGTALFPGAGTLAGISAGSGLGAAGGNLVGGIADAGSNKDTSGGGLQIGGGTAIQRRLTQSGDSPFQHVTDALNLVGRLPGPVQKQIAPILTAAYQKGYEQQSPNLGVNTQLNMGGIDQ